MKVGIQLYSVKTYMAQDPVAAIRQVVDTGYRYLEIANHRADQDSGVGFGTPAKDIKALLEDTGAKIVSGHIFPMTTECMARVLEYHTQIGTQYLAMPASFFTGRDDALRLADNLNQVGEQCAKAGVKLLYHNHFHEFQTFGGERVLDLLMANTNPALVGLELDTYWALRGAADPIAVLKQYGKRVRLIHQKDMPASAQAKADLLTPAQQSGATIDMAYFMSIMDMTAFTEIGTGIMDIQAIIDTANAACQSDYIILEQDATQHDEMESIRISMASFKQFEGIEW